LCIGPACEAGLSAGMRRECVTPHKKERKKKPFNVPSLSLLLAVRVHCMYYGHALPAKKWQ